MNTSLKKTLHPLKIELDAERKDMQGLIVRGYKSLNAARYILLKIEDGEKAKKYFDSLIENYITSAQKPADKKNLTENGDPKKAVQIAFTSSGLKNLQLSEEVLRTFSREFIEGMSHTYKDPEDDSTLIRERSTLLGDTKNNDPVYWRWGNFEKPVDCMLMLYAEYDSDLKTLINDVYHKQFDKGVSLVYMGKTFEYNPKISKEHFGFKDGISQPIIAGFTQSLNGVGNEKLINPGEFILGYKNEYDNYSPSPYVSDNQSKNAENLSFLPGSSDKKNLGKNGTYLVFRQIEQHVEKFWHFLYHHSKEAAVTRTEKAVKLAAKMIGRWPEGQPLVTCPNGNLPMDEASLNNFSYAASDKDGISCPLGAHIRRTNPRDQVHTGRGPQDSMEMSVKHRMLRRGRMYGKPLDCNMNIENIIDRVKHKKFEVENDDSKDCKADEKTPHYQEIKRKQGLHFICLVSDIERQFEFVQNVWANTSTFADLSNEVDPIISPRPTSDQPNCHEFTTPQEFVRNRYKSVPEFTTVVGGAYFFMPGINALKYIIRG